MIQIIPIVKDKDSKRSSDTSDTNEIQISEILML